MEVADWLHRRGLHSEAAEWLALLQEDVKENRRRLRRVHVELILLWIPLAVGGFVGIISYLALMN